MDYRTRIQDLIRTSWCGCRVISQFLGFGALAVAAAWWTWKMAGPLPRVVLSNDTIPAKAILAPPIAATHLFGEPVAPQAQVAAMPDVVVKGVFAEYGKAVSHAVLLVDRQAVIAAIGTEIRPGILLDQVRGDHVVFLRGGQSHVVPLETGKPAASIPLVK